ncbi:uncharacterized protein [Palaemon carinicauda]|uniref:uncharacterized protein n=1 Tax=Palaemon carinicauda TaxID=392227 RepID=UPI0035B6417F
MFETVSIMVLICVHLVSSLSTSESIVYNIQPAFYQPKTVYSFVKHNFNNENATVIRQQELSTSTVCYRFRILQHRGAVPFLSYGYSDKKALAFLQSEQAMEFYFNGKKEIPELVLDDRVEIWHHHCIVLTPPSYQIFIDGAFGTEGQLSAKSSGIHLNGTIYLGYDDGEIDTAKNAEKVLTGYVSQVNLWDYPLNVGDIKRMAECSSNTRGNVLSSDTTLMETFMIEEETVNIEHFCKPVKKHVIIPKLMYPGEAARFCSLVDASMYIPKSQEATDLLALESQQFYDQCGGDSHRLLSLRGASEDDEQSLINSNWLPGEHNTSHEENCLVLRKYDLNWDTTRCDFRICFPCSRTTDNYLQFRGLCQSTERQTRFMLDGYINSRPYFRGYYSLVIFSSGEKEWTLIDAHTNTTLAEVSLGSASEYPIGRHSWHVQSPFCNYDTGASAILGLSNCTTQQFMCSDGSCVDRSVRCNLQNDCPDRSDEEFCSLVLFADRYHSYRPPQGETIGVPLKIQPVIDIVRFSKIDDINLAFNMEIEVALMWIDQNLRFKNIKSDESKNVLSDEEVEGIWTPEIEFLNVNDGQLKLLKSGVFVKKTGEPEAPVFTDAQMDTIYPSKSSRLVQRQQYFASFTCYFTLFSYPFDVQSCQIIIKMDSADLNVINMENASVVYNGLKKLPKYEVQSIGINITSKDGFGVLEVTFKLERRYSLLVLVVFLPTFLLSGIGYGTLFIKLNDFGTRSNVALTTLLVLYTMFDQVSSNLPDTAYIKMVDLWFFFCIFLIFSITLVHIAVEYLPPGEDDDDEEVSGNFMIGRPIRVSPIEVLNGGKKEPLDVPKTNDSYIRLAMNQSGEHWKSDYGTQIVVVAHGPGIYRPCGGLKDTSLPGVLVS